MLIYILSLFELVVISLTTSVAWEVLDTTSFYISVSIMAVCYAINIVGRAKKAANQHIPFYIYSTLYSLYILFKLVKPIEKSEYYTLNATSAGEIIASIFIIVLCLKIINRSNRSEV